MKFENKILANVFYNFEWARINTVKIFEEAKKHSVLDYHPASDEFTFQSILFQFQCLVTTTDTYYRKLSDHENQDFGVLIRDKEIIPKKEISPNSIKKILQEQSKMFEKLLQSFEEDITEKRIGLFVSVLNHEYLHQGELIVTMREAGVDLPEEFRKAWAL